jgi:hypothetical protein
MKIQAMGHFLTFRGCRVSCPFFSNRQLKFKQSFETGLSRKQGIFVTFGLPPGCG